MTLIAAFRCAGNQAVLCADSQETHGDYKISVQKIQPRHIGPLYQVAYAASGYGDIVDALGEDLEQRLADCRASGSVSLRAALGKMLIAFYDQPTVKMYRDGFAPGDTNASPTGVICIRVEPQGDVFLFKFSATLVTPVDDFVLCGLDTPPYRNIAKRLYTPAILPLQARLLGLYVLAQASAESLHVGPPINVVFGMKSGMFPDDENNEIYLSAIVSAQQAADHLLLACADTHAVSAKELDARLKIFRKMIVDIRRSHAKELANHVREKLKRFKSTQSARKAPKHGR